MSGCIWGILALAGFIFWGLRYPEVFCIVLGILLWIGFGPYLGINWRIRKLKEMDPIKYSDAELGLIRRFPTFIFYPIASKGLARTFSACRFMSVCIAILFLWQHRWLELGVAILGWFIFGFLSFKLEPDFFMAEADPSMADASAAFEELRNKIRLHGL